MRCDPKSCFGTFRIACFGLGIFGVLLQSFVLGLFMVFGRAGQGPLWVLGVSGLLGFWGVLVFRVLLEQKNFRTLMRACAVERPREVPQTES